LNNQWLLATVIWQESASDRHPLPSTSHDGMSVVKQLKRIKAGCIPVWPDNRYEVTVGPGDPDVSGLPR
jgi:hypothetical protein